MTSIEIQSLNDDLTFGAVITGVTHQALKHEENRQKLRDVFEDRGLIVFQGVEASSQMHVALSNVFGSLKDHPVPGVKRVDQDAMPGVIDMEYVPGSGGVSNVNGTSLASWLPWHFDHCYNDELNRAGVLRAITIAPEGGQTKFADGADLYRRLSPALRQAIEGCNILYNLAEIGYETMRFGRPEQLCVESVLPTYPQVMDKARTMPRSVHPAAWTRGDGRRILHLSPWMASGIEGRENTEGDALLEAVCQEINAVANAHAYTHQWNSNDMLIWDNWRLLHSVSGADPKYHRRMQRTTIVGDYGLGYFEKSARTSEIPELV